MHKIALTSQLFVIATLISSLAAANQYSIDCNASGACGLYHHPQGSKEKELYGNMPMVQGVRNFALVIRQGTNMQTNLKEFQIKAVDLEERIGMASYGKSSSLDLFGCNICDDENVKCLGSGSDINLGSINNGQPFNGVNYMVITCSGPFAYRDTIKKNCPGAPLKFKTITFPENTLNTLTLAVPYTDECYPGDLSNSAFSLIKAMGNHVARMIVCESYNIDYKFNGNFFNPQGILVKTKPSATPVRLTSVQFLNSIKCDTAANGMNLIVAGMDAGYDGEYQYAKRLEDFANPAAIFNTEGLKATAKSLNGVRRVIV